MSWIKITPYEESGENLRKVYDKVKGKNNYIDNVLSVHSLRPHTLTGHMSLYKNVLHHTENKLPRWYLESLGLMVSYLNGCDYCVQHHLVGLKRIVEEEKGNKIMEHIESDTLAEYFEDKFLTGFKYAEKLTQNAETMKEQDVDILRVAGFSDGEILEINQVTCYFNYANRVVLGLGVSLEGDTLGLSPSARDSEEWSHK